MTTDELIRALRDEAHKDYPLAVSELMTEAADRLEELEERAKLRRIYIDNVTGNLKGQLDNTYIVRPDGTKVKVQKKLIF